MFQSFFIGNQEKVSIKQKTHESRRSIFFKNHNPEKSCGFLFYIKIITKFCNNKYNRKVGRYERKGEESKSERIG